MSDNDSKYNRSDVPKDLHLLFLLVEQKKTGVETNTDRRVDNLWSPVVESSCYVSWLGWSRDISTDYWQSNNQSGLGGLEAVDDVRDSCITATYT